MGRPLFIAPEGERGGGLNRVPPPAGAVLSDTILMLNDMRIKDFEKGIGTLCVQGLVIDEMKMKANSGGHVRQVNGHTVSLLVIWDELGRAFQLRRSRKVEFIEIGSGKAVTGRRLKRAPEFDLKFE